MKTVAKSPASEHISTVSWQIPSHRSAFTCVKPLAAPEGAALNVTTRLEAMSLESAFFSG